MNRLQKTLGLVALVSYLAGCGKNGKNKPQNLIDGDTKIIKLETLGIEFQDPKISFRDEGFVSDIGEHIKKIFLEFGKTLEYNADATTLDGYKCLGRYLYLKNTSNGDSTLRIFYLNVDPLNNKFIRAHEETHALHFSGKLKLLESKIKEDFPDFLFGKEQDTYIYSKCSDEELEFIANMGALYVLYRDGIDVRTLHFSLPPQYQRAVQIFKEMLQKKDISAQHILKELKRGAEYNWDYVCSLVPEGRIERNRALDSLRECLKIVIPQYKKMAEANDTIYWGQRLQEAETAFKSLKQGNTVKYRGIEL